MSSRLVRRCSLYIRCGLSLPPRSIIPCVLLYAVLPSASLRLPLTFALCSITFPVRFTLCSACAPLYKARGFYHEVHVGLFLLIRRVSLRILRVSPWVPCGFFFFFFSFFFFVTFPWQFNRPVFSSFLYICRVFLSFLVCSVLCQSDRPIVGEESPRFTVCSPWVTRYLSCTCVFPSVSISCDTCFPCIALYVTAEFHHEFPVGYLSLTFSMRSVSFAVSSVLCPRCVSLYRNYVLHYLPANFSYKFAVRSLTFLVCSTMCSPCVSLNGTLTFYHGFPMDSLPFPISSLVFFCVSSEFRALRSSYVARHGAPTFQHEFTVGSPISFLHIHGVSGHLSLDFLLMSHVGFARLLVYFVILSYVLCLLYDY